MPPRGVPGFGNETKLLQSTLIWENFLSLTHRTTSILMRGDMINLPQPGVIVENLYKSNDTTGNS